MQLHLSFIHDAECALWRRSTTDGLTSQMHTSANPFRHLQAFAAHDIASRHLYKQGVSVRSHALQFAHLPLAAFALALDPR